MSNETTIDQTTIGVTTDSDVHLSKEQFEHIQQEQDSRDLDVAEKEVATLEKQTVDLRKELLENMTGKSLEEISQEDRAWAQNAAQKTRQPTQEGMERLKKHFKRERPSQQASLLVPKGRPASQFIQGLIRDIRQTNSSVGADGTDHINIAEHAKTALGRFLDINSHTPIEHPELGLFQSVGGLWFFIKVDDDQRDDFRYTYGRVCRIKSKGRKFRQVDGFSTIIADATWIKILSNPEKAKELMESDLPFKNYFLYGSLNTVRHTPESLWYCDVVDECRRTLQRRHQENDDTLQPDFSFLRNYRT